jgi:hypothetical protein
MPPKKVIRSRSRARATPIVPPSPPSPSPSIGEYAKAGFGLGLGSMGVFILSLLLAVLFFVPGFIIVKRQQKLPKDQQSQGKKVLGYILMAIGMIIGLGFGAGVFFSLLGEDI